MNEFWPLTIAESNQNAFKPTETDVCENNSENTLNICECIQCQRAQFHKQLADFG